MVKSVTSHPGENAEQDFSERHQPNRYSRSWDPEIAGRFLKGEHSPALLPAIFPALPKEARTLQPAWPGADPNPKQSCRRAAGAAREHGQHPEPSLDGDPASQMPHTRNVWRQGLQDLGFINESKVVR